MEDNVFKAECPSCRGTRDCTSLYIKKQSWDAAEIEGWSSYEVLQCCGCRRVFFLHSYAHSEDTNEDGNEIIHRTYYPKIKKRIQEQRYDSYYMFFPNSKIEGLSKEIYSAINNDMPCLAAMGIRALIEVLAATLTNVEDDRFDAHMSRLINDGWVGAKQKETLDAALELGHGAIHRGHVPAIEDVQVALDIVENIIDLAIKNKEKAKALKQSIPPRNKKNTKSK